MARMGPRMGPRQAPRQGPNAPYAGGPPPDGRFSDEFTTLFGDGFCIFVDAHGLNDGAGPFYLKNQGGSLPTGYSSGVGFWVYTSGVGPDTVQLMTNQVDALAGTDAVSPSDDGTGTHTMFSTVDTVFT